MAGVVREAGFAIVIDGSGMTARGIARIGEPGIAGVLAIEAP
jgi:hypothetical protein